MRSRSRRLGGLTLLAGALIAGPPGAVDGQAAPADWVRLDEAHEIALARSAAPAEVSAEATIWALREGVYEVAVRGTNGNHCFVARSMPLSLEPICYDSEAAASVLPWEFEYLRLRLSGATADEREAALARYVDEGRIPLPTRPAMSYMMSSGQRLFDPASGEDAGNWRPHIMLYVPHLTHDAIGLTSATPQIQVARPGEPMAHLVVVVPDFVDPEYPASAEARRSPTLAPSDVPAGREARATLKRLAPILPVDAVEPALGFWERLGFVETARIPEEGRASFVMLRKDGSEIMLQTFAGFEDDADALGEIPRGGTLLYLEVDDLSAIEAELEGAEVLIPRRRMFYGAEELVVREPGGHIITFAQFAEGAGGGG